MADLKKKKKKRARPGVVVHTFNPSTLESKASLVYRKARVIQRTPSQKIYFVHYIHLLVEVACVVTHVKLRE